MWMNMSKEHVTAELDFSQSTANGNCSSVLSYMSFLHDIIEGYQGEIESLKQQLENTLQGKQEVEKCFENQLLLNDELKLVVSDLQEISKELGKTTPDCKEDRRGMASSLQALSPQEKSVNGANIPSTDEGKENCLSKLKANFKEFVSMLGRYQKENSELHQQCQMLNTQLNHAVASLVLNTENRTQVIRMVGESPEAVEAGIGGGSSNSNCRACKYAVRTCGKSMGITINDMLQVVQVQYQVPLLVLTMTATTSVKEDVVQSLGLTNYLVFVQSFNRSNLSLWKCHHCSRDYPEIKPGTELIQKHKERYEGMINEKALFKQIFPIRHEIQKGSETNVILNRGS